MSDSFENELLQTDLEEMELDTLQEAYADYREASMSGLLDDEEWEWLSDAWRELRERSDVQQPECPECGARNWGFDDRISCLECGRGTEYEEDELRKEIQKAWTAIIRGGGDDGAE